MIVGIGCDLVKVSRMKKWVETDGMIKRFFNEKEIFNEQISTSNSNRILEYYAGHFAVKESFGKALGCGLFGFDLREVYVKKDENGAPYVCIEGRAKELVEKLCGINYSVYVSISHEKEYAVANVVIENRR